MAAALKPSANVFALLEGNDPGDTRLADLGAAAKADAAASRPVNINKKQQPQMSVWKANKLKAEARHHRQEQAAAASRVQDEDQHRSERRQAGKNRKPQQPAASKAQVIGTTAVNTGKNIKRPQQQAASKPVYAAGNAANKPFQSQQQPPAPANLTQILFANAYPSARALIYKNRKQNAPANAKDGVAGGAPTDDKKGCFATAAASEIGGLGQFPSLK